MVANFSHVYDLPLRDLCDDNLNVTMIALSSLQMKKWSRWTFLILDKSSRF